MLKMISRSVRYRYSVSAKFGATCRLENKNNKQQFCSWLDNENPTRPHIRNLFPTKVWHVAWLHYLQHVVTKLLRKYLCLAINLKDHWNIKISRLFIQCGRSGSIKLLVRSPWGSLKNTGSFTTTNNINTSNNNDWSGWGTKDALWLCPS